MVDHAFNLLPRQAGIVDTIACKSELSHVPCTTNYPWNTFSFYVPIPRSSHFTSADEIPTGDSNSKVIIIWPNHNVDSVMKSWRHRCPTGITSAPAPFDPCRSPNVSWYPDPSILWIKFPSAIVERCPSPIIIGYPGPAVICPDPVSIDVWTPAEWDTNRSPALSIIADGNPFSIRRQRRIECLKR